MYQKLQSDMITDTPSRRLKDSELDELSKIRSRMLFRLLAMCIVWQGIYLPNSAKRPENWTVKPAPPDSAKSSGKNQADPVDQGEAAAGSQESESRKPPDHDESGRSSQDDSQIEAATNKLMKQIRENTGILSSLREDDDTDSRLLDRRREHWKALRLDLLKQTDKKSSKSQAIERDLVTASRSYSEQLEKVYNILEAMASYYEKMVSLYQNLETISGRAFNDEKEQANENKKKCMQRIANMQKSLSEVKTASEGTSEAGAAEDKLEETMAHVVETASEILYDVKNREPTGIELLVEFGTAIHAAQEMLATSGVDATYSVRASEIPESMAGRLRDLQRDHPELYKAWLRASTGAKPTSRHAPYTSPEP